jgi:hypothetical protein
MSQANRDAEYIVHGFFSLTIILIYQYLKGKKWVPALNSVFFIKEYSREMIIQTDILVRVGMRINYRPESD